MKSFVKDAEKTRFLPGLRGEDCFTEAINDRGDVAAARSSTTRIRFTRWYGATGNRKIWGRCRGLPRLYRVFGQS